MSVHDRSEERVESYNWDEAEARAERMRSMSNGKMLLILAVLGIGMFGFAFANIPLFGLVCEKLGFSQNPNSAAVGMEEGTSDRDVQVLFMGNVMGTLPVTFRPDSRTMKVQLGEQSLNDYYFTNMADRTVYFRPVHSIRPTEAAVKFSLSKCFCFDDQKLEPRQRVSLPVVFKLSTELPEDVDTVTLNYTLFEIDEKDYNPGGGSKE
ncbi:cytochrome c oxidase assembly protein [bacterium]|nr:cytochrome c oxidase assembly protein [bacterium]